MESYVPAKTLFIFGCLSIKRSFSVFFLINHCHCAFFSLSEKTVMARSFIASLACRSIYTTVIGATTKMRKFIIISFVLFWLSIRKLR